MAEAAALRWRLVGGAVPVTAALAVVPLFVSDYVVSLLLIIFANIAMATAWSFFSGTTRYISLATAAFVGVGSYAMAVLISVVPMPVALAAAALAGFLLALLVGLSTLRLRGVYFVIFTFGLAELIKQLMIWYEINENKTMMRMIFADVSSLTLYEILLGLAALVVVGTWIASHTRLGFALRAIGEDETVARHTGVNTTRVKVLVFAGSAAVIALTGAVLAMRYTYIDPNVGFNSVWSFNILIMALLGGPGRAWGPMLGVVPLVLLSEVLAGSFPHHFGIALGLCFVVIVYFLPGGIARLIERLAERAAGARERRAS
ncbi:MAG TPA: branched-chain amino acid ABC transporter permease [Alphaproteobacteria bacterium]|nr:branched-chain amino acid ABC transporter permease [Alphaproteobacteria bacterium]